MRKRNCISRVERQLLLMFFCLLSMELGAQQFRLGLNGNLILSSWDISETQGVAASNRPGGEAKLFASFPVAPMLWAEAGLGYGTWGARLRYTAGGEKVKYRLGYLQVPVLARYKIVRGLGLLAGPQLGYLVRAKGTDDMDNKVDAKEYFKPFDISLLFGIGYEFSMGLELQFRYSAGLNNVYDQAGTGIRNYSMGLGLNYRFRPAARWKE